eukprot:6776563-Prymnesium_polylepis.1
MTIVSRAHDAVVYMRFNGHPAADRVTGNFVGIGSLNHQQLQRAVVTSVRHWCGGRPRVLWLQSGYHDVAGANYLLFPNPSLTASQVPFNLTTEQFRIRVANHQVVWRSNANLALRWAEKLAPRRAWLSRHSGRGAPIDVTSLERHVQTTLLPRRTEHVAYRAVDASTPTVAKPQPWLYVDAADAWACETASSAGGRRHEAEHGLTYFDGIPMHIWTRPRGKLDEGYVLDVADDEDADAQRAGGTGTGNRTVEQLQVARAAKRRWHVERFFFSMLRTLQAVTGTYLGV